MESPDADDSWLTWSLGESVDEDDIPEAVNIEVELQRFRSQWQRELCGQGEPRKQGEVGEPRKQGEVGEACSKQASGVEQKDRNENPVSEPTGGNTREPTVEEQAKYLFVQGVNAEHVGRLYDAIKYYRRAIQLVPDIEFRVKDYRPRRRSERTDSESSVGSSSETEELDNLMQHFSNLQANDNGAICETQTHTQNGHISELPWEIIMYIFKWVVSMELDILSLERLSEVCRGFYVCARDEELWKLICQKTFGVNCGRPGHYSTYMNMYMQKPHVRFNGCYISRLEYFREGAKSLDGFYHPVHIVEYYRYVRFFPDGQMLMLTTPDNPYMALAKLRSRNSKYSGILYGYYKITSDGITAILKRHRAIENNPYQYRYKRRQQNQVINDGEQNFQVEFLLRSVGRRTHCQLVWNHYSIHTIYRLTGQEQIADFELTEKNYPSLIFSRVKSYTAMSQAPLQ